VFSHHCLASVDLIFDVYDTFCVLIRFCHVLDMRIKTVPFLYTFDFGGYWIMTFHSCSYTTTFTIDLMELGE
jgi:hypothetical protein